VWDAAAVGWYRGLRRVRVTGLHDRAFVINNGVYVTGGHIGTGNLVRLWMLEPGELADEGPTPGWPSVLIRTTGSDCTGHSKRSEIVRCAVNENRLGFFVFGVVGRGESYAPCSERLLGFLLKYSFWVFAGRKWKDVFAETSFCQPGGISADEVGPSRIFAVFGHG
jgi:hypothetical protein